MRGPEFLRKFKNKEYSQKKAYAQRLTDEVRQKVRALDSDVIKPVFDSNMNLHYGYRVALSSREVDDLVPGSFPGLEPIEGWAIDERALGKVICGLVGGLFVVRFELDKKGNVIARKEIGANFRSWIPVVKNNIVPNTHTIDGKIEALDFGNRLLDIIAPVNQTHAKD